ncbi:class I SAM-dependent methyltransferase [Streptomyces sp. NPDC048473]|uniref:class I SAM-dependent methyltransferase n=1 Tax=unclassified Streptomyces TaxID=2593676 RepID=UPI003721FB73
MRQPKCWPSLVRVPHPPVQFLEADLFEWQPPRRYDSVFFAFRLSHVPPTRLPDFWKTVAAALAPGGIAIYMGSDRDAGQRGNELILKP